MKKVMAAVVAVVGIAIAFVVFPIITDATTNLLTNDITQTITGTAASNTYVATVSNDVYENKTSAVTVTSSDADSNPVVSAVNGKSITITGLENGSQTLTIKYQTAALNDYTGLAAIVKIAPMLVFVVLIIGLVAGIFKAGNN